MSNRFCLTHPPSVYYPLAKAQHVFTLILFLRFAFPPKQSWSRETDLLARLAQLLVKLGTEAADKRFFKKLIYG